MTHPFLSEENNKEISEFLIAANPHLYDYAHFLAFKENNEVEFVDGAGQLINIVVKGSYKIISIDNSKVGVEFYNLREVNPYNEGEIVGEIKPFKELVHLETGFFPFHDEYFGKIENEENTPCLLYRQRYVFEYDPLTFAEKNQRKNLYNVIEDVDNKSLIYYYALPEQEKLSMKKLVDMGITENKFIE